MSVRQIGGHEGVTRTWQLLLYYFDVGGSSFFRQSLPFRQSQFGLEY